MRTGILALVVDLHHFTICNRHGVNIVGLIAFKLGITNQRFAVRAEIELGALALVRDAGDIQFLGLRG